MKKTEKLPVLNFESGIADDLLLPAEALYDHGGLRSIKNINGSRWESVVEDQKEYLIQLEVREEIIKSANCSCSGHLEQPCTHLVCSFYGLRREILEEPLRAKAKGTTRKSRSRDLVREILDRVEPTELNHFLMSFARKDKTFKLLFSAHFSRKIIEIFNENVYQSILNESFPVLNEDSRASITRNSQLLVKVVREILILFEDALSMEQYTDAFKMIHAIIQKLAYAIHVSPKPNRFLVELEQKAHELYSELNNDRLAPGLRHEIIRAMTDGISWSYYHYYRGKNLLGLLLDFRPSMDELKVLDSVLKNKIGQITLWEEKVYLLANLVIVQYKLPDRKHQTGKLSPFFKDPYLLFEVLHTLTNSGHLDEANFLSVCFRDIHLLEDRYFYQFQLKLELSRQNETGIYAAAMKLFEMTHDPQYLRTIKEASADQWPERYLQMIERTGEELPISRELLLTMVAWEKDLERLAQLLMETNDIQLFMRYDHLLVNSHPETILKYYRQYFLHYLASHAGTKAAQKLTYIQEHLQKIGLGKESSRLVDEMIRHFPERKSLNHLKSYRERHN